MVCTSTTTCGGSSSRRLGRGVAIHGSDRFRTNAAVAAGYGAGAALVVDEFALLVHLKDVYWAKRISVVLGAGLIAAVGASFAFMPVAVSLVDRSLPPTQLSESYRLDPRAAPPGGGDPGRSPPSIKPDQRCRSGRLRSVRWR